MKKERTIEKILKIDLIVTGSIFRIYKQCGKLNCKCSTQEDKRHGPYYIWTRKERGKTITKTLNEKQFKKCKKAIKNMEKVRKLIEKWKVESIKMICNE